MDLTSFPVKLLFFAMAIPSIVFHEVAHGYVALLLGDHTAKDAGRLTLNPLKHVDPVGTIMLPAIMALVGGPIFGYAKPVPLDPRYYKNLRSGMLFVGLAGPATNLVLATVSGLIVRMSGGIPGRLVNPVGYWVLAALYLLCMVNLLLMFINLIPIPPLDGSRVIPIFLSDAGMRVYAQVEQVGIWIVLAVIFASFFLPASGLNPLDWYFRHTVDPVLRLILGI